MDEAKSVLLFAAEVDQLETLCRGLSYLGLPCRPARSVAQALAVLGSPEALRIDVMLVDVTASGAVGVGLVARARALRPELSVLLVAGLVLAPEVIALRAQGIPLLRKPFTPEELGRAVEALRRRDRS
ncbi:MAG: hypothetical protein IT373_27280 [Polyangiaceae bacterium]|nr:hypothetical protein [Polyangiaceae bacterium]